MNTLAPGVRRAPLIGDAADVLAAVHALTRIGVDGGYAHGG